MAIIIAQNHVFIGKIGYLHEQLKGIEFRIIKKPLVMIRIINTFFKQG